jgi:predicted metal-dependent phosphoesterase TrpH
VIGDDEFRVDMHVKIVDERVVSRAKERGLDALVYAPHFTRLPEIQRRAEHFSDDELTVMPAREIFTGDWRTRKHVLGIGLSEPVPDFITLDGAIEELQRQSAAILIPHPEFATVSCSEADIQAHREAIDAVETYNPKHWRRHNRRAQEIARNVDLPAFTSSYAHLHGTVGESWTAFGADLDSTAALVDALHEDAPRRVFHRRGLRHRLRCLAEFAHLGYENTYEKIDRVFLSGTEPTHPGHVAYDGRFDDVRLY